MEWNTEWPKTPGWYWFYGHFKNNDSRLIPVHVIQLRDGFMHVGDGCFLYPSEVEGVWQPLLEPVLPAITKEQIKMTWNHRVVRKHDEAETMLGIHEVFYDAEGAPDMVTVDPVGVSGETLEELVETLDWMRKALGQPILEYSDIGKEE